MDGRRHVGELLGGPMMVFEHFKSFGRGFRPFWALLTRAPNRQSARFGEKRPFLVIFRVMVDPSGTLGGTFERAHDGFEMF